MEWSKILRELSREKIVNVPYEASIAVVVKKMLGDIPIYNFKVSYFEKGCGLVVEEFDTFKQLVDCTFQHEAFRHCSEDGSLITGTFYTDNSLNKDYCCMECLAKALNREFGQNNWSVENVDGQQLIKVITEDQQNEFQDIFDGQEDEDFDVDNNVDFVKDLQDNLCRFERCPAIYEEEI